MNVSIVVPAFRVRQGSFLGRAKRQAKSLWCVITNGGHELYEARTDVRLFQRCLLCGHETKGWTIDRADQRLHLAGRRKAS